jgi:hypothetical protein
VLITGIRRIGQVNVSTIGESNDFPAFYTRVSGFKASRDGSPLEMGSHVLAA